MGRQWYGSFFDAEDNMLTRLIIDQEQEPAPGECEWEPSIVHLIVSLTLS